MAVIAIKAFSGMKPISDPLLLGQNEAQLARNVRLISGAITALRGTTQLKSAAGSPQTIFRYGSGSVETNYWLEWPGDVDVVRSPIAQDQWDRLYWTDGGDPKYAPNNLILSGGSYPGGFYKLGVPKPTAKPEITASTAVPVYTKVTRSYVFTFLNPTTGKESSASTPFTVQAVDGFKVAITLPTDNGGDAGVTKKRLYREVAGTYRRVAELDVTAATYEDTAKDADLSAAPTLGSGVAARPSAPTTAPSASAPSVALTAAAISRQYLYTVKNVQQDLGEGGINYFEESSGSNVVTISADETQTVTISGMATTGVTTTGNVFRVYRKDANDSVFRFIGESTTSTFADAISSNPTPSILPAYAPDAPNTIRPTTNPSAAAGASTAVTSASKRIYAVTFVDGSGNESSISPASNVVDAVNGKTVVSVRHSATAPSGATKRRLYRQTVTFSGGVMNASDANWRLVIENPANSTSFSDDIADANLGGALPSALQGLPTTPSGSTFANAEIPAPVIPESRTYVYTFVSAYGEEGAPSDASTVVELDPSKAVTVSLPAGAPAGAYNFLSKRIYRSSTVGSQAKFQFVAEVPIATISYVDQVKQAELGEVLPSENWLPPPTGMKGLKMMANGVAIGFLGNTVFMSEPNLPHAWPHQYTVDYEIVGLGTFGQTVVVLTKGYPYLMQGVDPAAMSTSRLPLPQSCSSKRSIVDTGDGTLYASPDGLVSIGSGGIQVISQGTLSRDQWQAYKPDTINAYLYNSRWHGFCTDSSGTRVLLIFDFSGQGATMTVSNINQSAAVSAGYYDAATDILYLAQSGGIQRHDTGAALTYLWRSKTYRMPQQMNFSVAQVRAKAYPVTMRVYADGVLKHTQTVASANHFRLPAGFKGLDWHFELEGTSEITEVFLATSIAELMAV